MRRIGSRPASKRLREPASSGRCGQVCFPNQGLRLTFVLEPAYYLGMVEFPELAKHFSYVRLLQVVNFSGQDPYDKYLLPGKEAALTNFLTKNGYFEAKVHAETVLDDVNQIVNVTFRVQMGRRAKIGVVQIQGTDRSEEHTSELQ